MNSMENIQVAPAPKVAKRNRSLRLVIILFFFILAIVMVEGGVYLFKYKYQKKANFFQQKDVIVDSGNVNTEDTPKESKENVPKITVIGPALENESFYEGKANISRDERLLQAKKVLKEHYSSYDENSLGREFGVYQHDMGGVLFLTITGGVRKVNQQGIEVDCGDFAYIAAMPSGIVINELNKDNSVKYQIPVDQIKVGDLVSLFYGRDNDQGQRNLWVILKYL